MKIQFTKSVELEVITNYYEGLDSFDSCNESFQADETIEVEQIADYDDTVDLQFGNGSVSLSVPKDCFSILYPEDGINLSITFSAEDRDTLMKLRLQDDSGIIDHILDHIEEKLEQL
jgi:hypothetical protein